MTPTMEMMELPAPARWIPSDGGATVEGNDTQAEWSGRAWVRPDGVYGERLSNRAYVQALIDHRGLTVEAIDRYADTLVSRHWSATPENRDILRAAIVAYMEGWDTGFIEGYEAGVEEGKEIASGEYRDC